MDLLVKSKDKKAEAKKYFSKFQSILMQVAKSGVVSKRTGEKFGKCKNFQKSIFFILMWLCFRKKFFPKFFFEIFGFVNNF